MQKKPFMASLNLLSCFWHYRCCPNVRVLSLKSNNLELIPPEIGRWLRQFKFWLFKHSQLFLVNFRLQHLKQLYLTNNRLQNGSIPYTLEFCTNLEELYLDDNLLDALPSILLVRISNDLSVYLFRYVLLCLIFSISPRESNLWKRSTDMGIITTSSQLSCGKLIALYLFNKWKCTFIW